MNPRASCVREAVAILISGLLLTAGTQCRAQATDKPTTAGSGACAGDNGGITLSPGFCATVFADKLGHARHLVVSANGVVYANTWSGATTTTIHRRPAGF